MNKKPRNIHLQILQITIRNFCKIAKITKEELYSKLGIISTKNLPDFELQELTQTINNTLKSIIKIGFLKVFLVKICVQTKLALSQIKQSFSIKNQFKKLNIYSKNYQSFIFSKNYQKTYEFYKISKS